MQTSDSNFVYLNRENRWPGFHLYGLEIRADGAVQLCSVPSIQSDSLTGLQGLPVPDGPAGIAVDRDGTVYFSDPSGNAVKRRQGCDGKVATLQCLGRVGTAPGQFNTPRGLLIGNQRRALFVADSGNHRIQILDPDTQELLGIWGEPGLATPAPSSAPGRFDTPWTLAQDSLGYVYVLDYGNKRVQQFNPAGDVVASFSDAVLASGCLQQPCDVAIWEHEGQVRVLVADSKALQMFVFDSNGHAITVQDQQGNPIPIGAGSLFSPMGMAVHDGILYIGDNVLKRVLAFQLDADFALRGEARGYELPVAALAVGMNNDLWVHPGGSSVPLELLLGQAYRTHGILWSDPVVVSSNNVQWSTLRSELEELSPNVHLQLLCYTSSKLADAPLVEAGSDNPFSDPKWHPHWHDFYTDITDSFIGGEPARYLWIGAQFSSSGTATPIVRQMRVDFDREGYERHLPVIYRAQTGCGDFLVRFLGLFESFLTEVEGGISGLPALFDSAAVRKEFLPWLAGWLGLALDESWSEAKKREAIAGAFAAYARRGTARGLQERLWTLAGVNAVIEEPIQHAAWWSLPSHPDTCCSSCHDHASSVELPWEGSENSRLGWSTMLAPAQASGAVIGATAVLDQSHLIPAEDFGTPLFSDLAFQFSVLVYQSDVVCTERMARLKAVLEQERPAHTQYQLCIIRPEMRVGLQGRIGIDTVVAGERASFGLGSEKLGEGTALGGAPLPRIGESRLGMQLHVG